MNCERVQRRILLAQAGELPARHEPDLARHLAGCPACREYAAAAERLTAGVRRALPAGTPSPAVLAAIRSAAGRSEAAGVAPAIAWRRPAVQVLAWAAALAVAVLGWLSYPSGRRAVEPGVHLSSLVEIVAEDHAAAAEPAPAGTDGALRALAARLLQMEGLAEEEAAETQTATPDAEPQPTTLRSRSRPASDAERCV
jgi:anti-sigma factor RsiW